MFGLKVKCGRGSFRLDGDQGQAMLDYLVRGCPAPPPDLVKFASIAHYQELTGYRHFIETGTYLGDTLAMAAEIFDKCYSVELAQGLYQRARSRFSSKRHVELLNGSSADLLRGILAGLTEPAVIWLDAHFSGGNTAGEGSDPLQQELTTLLKYREMQHIILIDDARGLGISDSQLSGFIAGMGAGYHASLLHDSVRVVPVDVPLLGTPVR